MSIFMQKSLSYFIGSNHKSGRLMEVCIYECAVVLDTRWEKLNWMDDITCT